MYEERRRSDNVSEAKESLTRNRKRDASGGCSWDVARVARDGNRACSYPHTIGFSLGPNNTVYLPLPLRTEESIKAEKGVEQE
jgi:hypothetical protein